MAKNSLRQTLLARRKRLEVETCRALSRQLQQQLIATSCFQQASSLALYSPINNEVQTSDLLKAALQTGKRVYYPRVSGERLQFCRVNSAADLSPGAFGVAEPIAAPDTVVEQLDLIVVPGVAFDRSGYRLGYGKGFYDRELARVPAATLSVGLCFEFQLCPAVPHEAHDRPVRLVVTEHQIIPCHTNVAV
jgi:5-formyltetrahydrofolate cyclo-ligase